MNEIVITGSTGVIGRRAVRELLAAGYRVAGVTRSGRAALSFVVSDGRITRIDAIRNPEKLRRL
jgi:nucleoside-diphosphate-sugar epimerase